MESEAIAKMNDRLRRTMPTGQLNVELSGLVTSAQDRAKIIKAVRDYRDFDPEIDLTGDHSVGLVIVTGAVYVFRFTYGDARYNYGHEVGQRKLSIMHSSEFRSLKLGRLVQSFARKVLEQGVS